MACQPCRMSDKSLQVNSVASNRVPAHGCLHSWEYEGRGVEQKTALNYSVMSGYYPHPTRALTTAQQTRLLEAALSRNKLRNTKHRMKHKNNSFTPFCKKIPFILFPSQRVTHGRRHVLRNCPPYLIRVLWCEG